MKAEVILRRRGENKGDDKSKEVNVAMETQEEQYSPSDFINHLVSDEKLAHRGSPSSSTSPINKQSVTKVNPQTVIRPVPIMPLDSSFYSTPPTYIDNVPSAAKVPVVSSSLLATHLATSNIRLSANNETGAHLVGVLQTQSQNVHESSQNLLDCKWLNCQCQFRSMDELVSHVNDHHVRVERPDIDYQCKWDRCPRKGKGFNARYKMLIHIRTHTNEKPHKCSRCGKSFSRLENLKIHMRSHTGEKPYTCPFEGCSKAYSNSSDRFKHVRTHQEDKPYICKMPGCSKRYTDPSSLRKHVRTHGHHYKEGSQLSAGNFQFNSNLVQDNSIETYKTSSTDYSMSVTKSGSVPSMADSDLQENSCLHFFNISSLVSNPLLSSGVIPVGAHAAVSTAEIPVTVTVKSLSADSLANFGQQESIKLTSPSSQVEPLDLSTCSNSSASCESGVDGMACQQNPQVEHSITPEIGRWEIVQMSS